MLQNGSGVREPAIASFCGGSLPPVNAGALQKLRFPPPIRHKSVKPIFSQPGCSPFDMLRIRTPSDYAVAHAVEF